MLRFVTSVLGDGVLMYASDYPHPESPFSDLPSRGALGLVQPGSRRHAAGCMWDNATRFFAEQ